jgi:hypothetical protein
MVVVVVVSSDPELLIVEVKLRFADLLIALLITTIIAPP